jgi:ribosomal protein S8
MEEQLKSLDNLKKEGFIQEAEYNRRKAELTVRSGLCDMPPQY